MHHADAMAKSRMLRPVIDQISKAELANPAKSLKGARANQPKKHRLHRIIDVEGDDIMDGVAKKFRACAHRVFFDLLVLFGHIYLRSSRCLGRKFASSFA